MSINRGMDKEDAMCVCMCVCMCACVCVCVCDEILLSHSKGTKLGHL